MYCARCDTRLREDARYCQRCGAPVRGEPYAARDARPASGSAVGAMVCGILSLACFCVPGLNLVLGILGVSLGWVAIRKANAGLGRSKGVAIAGLVCGILGGVWGLFHLLVVILGRAPFLPLGKT